MGLSHSRDSGRAWQGKSPAFPLPSVLWEERMTWTAWNSSVQSGCTRHTLLLGLCRKFCSVRHSLAGHFPTRWSSPQQAGSVKCSPVVQGFAVGSPKLPALRAWVSISSKPQLAAAAWTSRAC